VNEKKQILKKEEGREEKGRGGEGERDGYNSQLPMPITHYPLPIPHYPFPILY
jgi:hypothetical protein